MDDNGQGKIQRVDAGNEISDEPLADVNWEKEMASAREI